MTFRDPRIGKTIASRFRIERPLGEGQMARVYIAEQVSMKRKVALKILHPELANHKSAPLRFQREVEAVTRLRSPHTIVFYDFGQTEEGDLYIAMELLEGETLRAQQERQAKLSLPLVLSIVRQICRCLDEAHAAGVLHRDLKPENIFLCPSVSTNGEPFVKVLDFGLAKLLELQETERSMHITSPSVTVGTPAYLAPEMALAERTIDPRADLYALGVMAFEMMVGRLPFDEPSPHQMMMAHVRSPIPKPSQCGTTLPPGTDAFMEIALAKKPDDRFQAAKDFAASLGAALGERRR